MLAPRLIISTLAILSLAAAPSAASSQTVAAPETPPAAAPAVTSQAAPEAAPVEAAAEQAAPAPSAPEVDPSVYQVVRATDRAMTCDVLIAEINTTNAKMSAQRAAAMDKMSGAANRSFTGALATTATTSLLGSIASAVPMGSTIMNAATQASRASSMNSMNKQVTEAQKDLMTSENDVQARLNHLSRLYESKQC